MREVVGGQPHDSSCHLAHQLLEGRLARRFACWWPSIMQNAAAKVISRPHTRHSFTNALHAAYTFIRECCLDKGYCASHVRRRMGRLVSA